MPGKRELMKPNGDLRYVRRDARGRIVESDDVGRSLAQDRRRRARTASGKGQGDKGDRPATKAKAKANGKTTAAKATRGKTTRKKTARKKKGGAKPGLKATAFARSHRMPIVA
jgi:hypothetical protein